MRTLDFEVLACQALRGLHTPERRLVVACLESYAAAGAGGGWVLREEDRAEARAKDVEDMRELLLRLGARLGYRVAEADVVVWETPAGSGFRFRVQPTAAVGGWLSELPVQGDAIVLPGGRVSLLAEKERRDPRLRAWRAAGGRIVKFRHVRRLAADTSLVPGNFVERMEIDPAEREDPQLPLL
jgi:hypothetical protein